MARKATTPRKRLVEENERLRLEIDQLLQASRTADEARNQYMDVFDFGPLPSLTLDAVGVVRDLNRAALELLDADRHSLVGARLKRWVHDEDHRVLAEHMRECPARADPFGTHLRLRDGTPVQLWSRRIRPGLRVYPTVIIDLTERERVIDETRRQVEKARDASLAKDRFMATLSHELRTPLTPVLAAVTGLKTRADVPASLRSTFEMIRRNVQTEARLVDDLLDLTRIVQRKMRVERRPTDLHTVAREVIETLAPDVAAKHVLVVTSLAAEHHHASADPLRLKQVFWNLVRNALKFTPDGGRIELRSWNNSSAIARRLLVEVSDSGAGFDPDQIARLFEPFEQGDGAREQHGGLGLGLAICRGVMDLHGGRIAAASPGPGQGARFVIEIDTIDDLPERVEAPAAPVTSADGGRKARILLVEDDPDTADLLSQLLEDAGFVVQSARSAQAALAVDLDAIDVMISDIGLPGISGLDLMRDVHAGHAVKGVALSGYGTEADIVASREAGFSAHLTKPVEFDRLLETIRTVSAERQRSAIG
jgi:signal transduction histidine kinase/ActR/RegA family two-component response regulator